MSASKRVRNAQAVDQDGQEKKSKQKQVRAWCFTLPNYTEEDVARFSAPGNEKLLGQSRYLFCGLEVCPETGTPHFQGYVYWKSAKTLSATKKLLGRNDFHLEEAKGNASQNWEYCKKEGNVICDHGSDSIVSQGERTDLKKIKEDLVKGKSLNAIIMEDPVMFHQYGRTLTKLSEIAKSERVGSYRTVKIVWIHGPTGRGKTRMCVERGCKNVTFNNGFFSDWGERRIISIEELRGEIPYRELLKLTDQVVNYYEVQIKGGYKLVDLDEIWITSPYTPEAVYRNQATKVDSIEQLLRRITCVIDLGKVSYDEAQCLVASSFTEVDSTEVVRGNTRKTTVEKVVCPSDHCVDDSPLCGESSVPNLSNVML